MLGPAQWQTILSTNFLGHVKPIVIDLCITVKLKQSCTSQVCLSTLTPLLETGDCRVATGQASLPCHGPASALLSSLRQVVLSHNIPAW